MTQSLPALWCQPVPAGTIAFVYTRRSRSTQSPHGEPYVLFPGDTLADVINERLGYEPAEVVDLTSVEGDPHTVALLAQENERTEGAVAHLLAVTHACGACTGRTSMYGGIPTFLYLGPNVKEVVMGLRVT